MIFISLAPPPSSIDNLIVTTVEKEKFETMSNHSITTLEPVEDNSIKTSLKEIIQTKSTDSNTFTTLSIRDEIESGLIEGEKFNFFTEDYNLFSPLKVEKTLRVKARVRSVSHISPKVYID